MTFPSSLRQKQKLQDFESLNKTSSDQKMPFSLRPKKTKSDLEQEERKKLYEQAGYGKEIENILSNKTDKNVDLLKTFAKGAVEGISKLGRIMGPTLSGPEELLGQKKEITSEEQSKQLDKFLPTENNFIQRGLRRGLKEAPSVTAFPFGSAINILPRSIYAGFLGEGAKDLGAPEWAQTAAELTAYIGPDLTKKLISSGKNKEIIEAAKKLGLSDEAITPLIQSDFKQKWLSKLSPRRGRTQEALNRSYNELGESYSKLESSPLAKGEISEIAEGKFLNNINQKFDKIPRKFRDEIERDFQDLINNKITGERLINFYKKVNKTFKGDRHIQGLLKGPIKDAIKSISPELGEDFDMINNLFSKYYKIESKLKPNLMTDIMGASEALGTLFSVATGNYVHLASIAGEKTARTIAREMLTNPRFQQISDKFITAINENKFAIAKKLADLYAHNIEEISPEVAEKLRKLSLDELKDYVTHRQETSDKLKK